MILLQMTLWQTKDRSAKKQYSAPPEYLEKRKQERERRRSETGLRQKFKRSGRKSETTTEVKIYTF